MKIKCVPVDGSRNCAGCQKYSRPCEPPEPSKPRVRSARKLLELEQKIELLTKGMRKEQYEGSESRNPARSYTTQRLSSHHISGEDNRSLQQQSSPSRQPQNVASLTNATNSDIVRPSKSPAVGYLVYPDPIDKGWVDLQTAIILFNHWKNYMRPIMPIIQLDSEQDFHKIRSSKPVLFLTILTVGSTSILPALEFQLLGHLNEELAQKVFIEGVKSIDLLQSLLLISHYGFQLPHAKSSVPNLQYIRNAVAMTLDLGIGETRELVTEDMTVENLEACSTWLGTYHAASTTAALLNPHNFNMSRPRTQGCIRALIQSDRGTTNDSWLCRLVELQQVVEDASVLLNDLTTIKDESFDNPKTQYMMKMFHERLGDQTSSSDHVDSRLEKHVVSATELYIYQIAIIDYNHRLYIMKQDKNHAGNLQPPITTAHFNALCRCLELCREVMMAFLSMDETLTRLLPNIFFIWNMYAAVSLVKLGAFAESLIKSRFNTSHSIDEPSGLDLLDAMSQRISDLTRYGYMPQLQPYKAVFVKLKIYYVQKKNFCVKYHEHSKPCDGPIENILDEVTVAPSSLSRPMNGYSQSMHFLNDNNASTAHHGELAPSNNHFLTPTFHDLSAEPGSSGQHVDNFNTTWDTLDFDSDAMREFDAFIMESGNTWMGSLLE
ncbi:hypothetical protein B0O99DRAFT_686236 [Bisporella sp. PMI_857]|nr:hypothetical protein B0O99DRAFT_686236 [Bisporella sp. PMI_857]